MLLIVKKQTRANKIASTAIIDLDIETSNSSKDTETSEEEVIVFDMKEIE
jgi:hypothetical protein